MVHPIRIHDQSPFLDEACALCKEPFAVGEDIVICPQDGSRHHDRCWRANGNRCTAYGCSGAGEIVFGEPVRARPSPRPSLSQRQRSRVISMPDAPGGRARSKVRALPFNNLGCARSCLILAIALAIVLCALGCFGLWALADYIAVDVMGWDYRAPLSGVILPLFLLIG